MASYAFRPGITKPAATYTLTPSELVAPGGTIPLAAIHSLRIYTLPGTRSLSGVVAQPQARCVVHVHGHSTVMLSSLSFVSFGRFDDQTPAFRIFIAELVSAVRAVNPTVPILAGMPPAIWWSWMAVWIGLLAVCALVLCALITMMFTQGMQWPLLIGVAAVLAIAYSPFSLLRATWGRRSHPAGALDETGNYV